MTNPTGRPRKFKSVESLKKRIDEYFDYCDNRTKEFHSEKLGDVVTSDPEPYTMSGLAFWLGMDRRALLTYSKRKEFVPTIKAARNRVELDVERRMNDKATFTPGLIFNAKNNFSWVDKKEIDYAEKPKFVMSDETDKI